MEHESFLCFCHFNFGNFSVLPNSDFIRKKQQKMFLNFMIGKIYRVLDEEMLRKNIDMIGKEVMKRNGNRGCVVCNKKMLVLSFLFVLYYEVCSCLRKSYISFFTGTIII